MDMGSYVIENYHVPLNNDESDKDVTFEKETSELCKAAFSKREAEFLEHGVDNYVQCMTDGKFIFAANMGKKGNFGFSFDVGNDPAAIDEEFSVGLDKLINQLNALDDEPEDAGPGDLGNMQETSRKRKKEPFFPHSILVLSILIAIISLRVADALYRPQSTVEEDESTSGETNNDRT